MIRPKNDLAELIKLRDELQAKIDLQKLKQNENKIDAELTTLAQYFAGFIVRVPLVDRVLYVDIETFFTEEGDMEYGSYKLIVASRAKWSEPLQSFLQEYLKEIDIFGLANESKPMQDMFDLFDAIVDSIYVKSSLTLSETASLATNRSNELGLKFKRWPS